MASFLSDRIVDEILESLSRSQHTLVSVCPSVFLSVCQFFCESIPPSSLCLQADHLIRKPQPLLRQEPHLETEVLDEVVLQPENNNQARKQSRDGDQKRGLEDMDTCMVRKTLHTTRLFCLLDLLLLLEIKMFLRSLDDS